MPLKLVRRHGSPFFYLRGAVRGLCVDESTRTVDRKAAEQIRIKREAELLDQSIHGHRAVITFAGAAVSYMEETGNTRFLTPIIHLFGTKKLGAIGQAEIDAMAAKLYSGRSPATINRQAIGPAVAVLNHAARKGWCDKPIIGRRKEPDGRVRWITPEEADRLLAAASAHLKPLLTFMLLEGSRLSEALYLDWRDVDLRRAHVTFPQTKNGEARGVPLHPVVVAALANLGHREGAVFLTNRGKPYEPKGDDEGGGQIKTAFNGACRRAEIDNFTPHDCRHTWATWTYAATRDLLGLQRLGGWKSLKMVERYAHVNVSNLAPMIEAISWGKSMKSKSSKENKRA